jgi:tetratricopeptide (TPR) repeat protein
MTILVFARCTRCKAEYSMDAGAPVRMQCPGCGQSLSADEVGTVFFNSGNSLAEKGSFEQAIGQYSAAVRYNPRDKEAYNNRGLCHGSLDDHAAAIRDYDEALRIDPGYEDAAFNRSLAVRGQRP